MAKVRILLLAGTAEARQLAQRLAERPGLDVTASLAGATLVPKPLAVATRRGGFGGLEGLASYLHEHKVDAVIDATHPFAAMMSANAVKACRRLGIPHLRVERPGWTPPDGADWVGVSTLEEAADVLPTGARAFLTVGSHSLEPFGKRDDVWFLVRLLEQPEGGYPFVHFTELRDAPSRSKDAERDLMRKHGITHLVTKNAGGGAVAKLHAAAELDVQTVVIARPVLAPAETVPSVDAAIEWVQRLTEQA